MTANPAIRKRWPHHPPAAEPYAILLRLNVRESRALLVWIAEDRVSPAWLGVVFDRLSQAVKAHERRIL